MFPEQPDLFRGQGSRKVLGVVFDAVDFSYGPSAFSRSSACPRESRTSRTSPGQEVDRSPRPTWVKYDFAPAALLDRDDDLAQWHLDCFRSAYVRWQAGPWSGKTAPAAWFVTHPPDGVDVISFFVTQRLDGQTDSRAFLKAMIEQTRGLLPDDAPSADLGGAIRGSFVTTLERACQAAAEKGRQLVLVVDGLDEDRGPDQPDPLPSIAAILPKDLPGHLTIITTSREEPGIPDDVDEDHPLRRAAIRRLRTAPMAQVTERPQLEIRRAVALPGPAREILGLLVAAGGGLTYRDLCALSDDFIDGQIALALSSRAARWVRRPTRSAPTDRSMRPNHTSSPTRPCPALS